MKVDSFYAEYDCPVVNKTVKIGFNYAEYPSGHRTKALMEKCDSAQLCGVKKISKMTETCDWSKCPISGKTIEQIPQIKRK